MLKKHHIYMSVIYTSVKTNAHRLHIKNVAALHIGLAMSKSATVRRKPHASGGSFGEDFSESLGRVSPMLTLNSPISVRIGLSGHLLHQNRPCIRSRDCTSVHFHANLTEGLCEIPGS